VTGDNPLMRGIGERAYFYFAHSYYAPVDAFTIGVSEDGAPFSAIMRKENYFGVQFHPEKSGERGLKVLNNFQTICSSYPQ
jgi:glutamine amidotransferase